MPTSSRNGQKRVKKSGLVQLVQKNNSEILRNVQKRQKRIKVIEKKQKEWYYF